MAKPKVLSKSKPKVELEVKNQANSDSLPNAKSQAISAEDKPEVVARIVRRLYLPKGGVRVGHGSTGGVFGFTDDPTIVAKLPFMDKEHIERLREEEKILLRLGADGRDGGTGLRHIVRYIRMEENEDGGRLILERAKHGTVRDFLRNTEDGKGVTLAKRIRWCHEVAEAVVYIHGKGVIQGDLGTRNILLREDYTLCFCDFAGSGIDGKEPIVWAQSGFCSPNKDLHGTVQDELHALGSVFYELVTSTTPHWEEERVEIEKGYGEGKATEMMKEGIYPDVSGLPLGNVISKCWKGEYPTAQAVLDALENEFPTYIQSA